MADEQQSLWGVWGGRPPGGWCSFLSTHPSADRRPQTALVGYAYVGSRGEAEAGRETLSEEYGDRQIAYEVVPFDATREPVADEVAVPTPAQAAFLRELIRTGDYNGSVMGALGRQVSSTTTNVLHDRGWFFSYKPDPTTLHGDFDYFGRALVTPAGRRALARYDAKEGE